MENQLEFSLYWASKGIGVWELGRCVTEKTLSITVRAGD